VSPTSPPSPGNPGGEAYPGRPSAVSILAPRTPVNRKRRFCQEKLSLSGVFRLAIGPGGQTQTDAGSPPLDLDSAELWWPGMGSRKRTSEHQEERDEKGKHPPPGVWDSSALDRYRAEPTRKDVIPWLGQAAQKKKEARGQSGF